MTAGSPAPRHPAPPPAAPGALPPADSRALKGKRGLQRVVNALRYSIDGLGAAWSGEDAFRQEAILAAVLLPLALLLPALALVERLLMVGAVLLVLIVELLNTAVEAAIDRHSFEINPLAKRAKDLGSAAVLMTLLLAAAIWIAILWSHYG